MTRLVRPWNSTFSARWIASSVKLSILAGGLVQDQDLRIGHQARAKLISWRGPIETLRPRWPVRCHSRSAA